MKVAQSRLKDDTQYWKNHYNGHGLKFGLVLKKFASTLNDGNMVF